MLAPASALAWHLWLRARPGLVALAGFLLLLALITHVAPTLLAPQEVRIMFVVLPMCMGILLILGAFTHADADISAPESGYPTCLLVLPIPSWQLVFWPMLYGVVCAALVWLGFAALVLRPLGASAPLWWPAATVAAYMATLQALTWTPMGVPYVRVVALTVAMLLLLLNSLIASMENTPPEGITSTMLWVIPVAAIVAYLGVRGARHGSAAARGRVVRLPKVSIAMPADNRPFRSPEQAQFWFEWKRNGWALPLITLVLCSAMAVMVMLDDTVTNLRLTMPTFLGFDVGFHNVQARLSIVFAFVPFYLLPVLGLVLGAGINKLDTRRRDHCLQPFLAVRPLSSELMLSAKLRRITLSTLLSWGIALLFALLVLMMPGHLGPWPNGQIPDQPMWMPGVPDGPLLYALASAMSVETGSWLLLALLVLMVLTWRNQAQRISVDLSGKEWIVRGFPIATVFLGTLYLSAPVTFAETGHEAVALMLPLVVWQLVVAKLAGALLVMRRLRERGLASTASLTTDVLAWAGVLALLLGLLFCQRLETDALVIASGVIVLALPAARLGLAPMALEASRHQ